MSILRFGHIGICVSDMETSVAFYRGLLGFRRLSSVNVSGDDADKLLRLKGIDQETVFLERD
ncbi:MAG: catechol 2,3-dioxygenase-like lactoylglutathione lyase family enzyme, partial [Candidatus Binatia bacterium]